MPPRGGLTAEQIKSFHVVKAPGPDELAERILSDMNAEASDEETAEALEEAARRIRSRHAGKGHTSDNLPAGGEHDA